MAKPRKQRRPFLTSRLIEVVLAAFVLAVTAPMSYAMSAHDFTLRAIDGSALPLQRFRGQPIVLVNTASQCGFTPQYKDLQTLWDTYRDRGLIVVGIPSNDFGRQEPGSAQQIKTFCEVNYGVNFPLTTKQHVIGSQAHPLYRWIVAELGAQKAPQWNFHKYLIAPNGSLAASWPSHIRPLSLDVKRAIEAMLPTP
jgi:glutathione peroxidase